MAELFELLVKTYVWLGVFFLYFNFVYAAADFLARKLVHYWNLKIQAEKAEERRVEWLCLQDYLKWLHQDPCWIGE